MCAIVTTFSVSLNDGALSIIAIWHFPTFPLSLAIYKCFLIVTSYSYSDISVAPRWTESIYYSQPKNENLSIVGLLMTKDMVW